VKTYPAYKFLLNTCRCRLPYSQQQVVPGVFFSKSTSSEALVQVQTKTRLAAAAAGLVPSGHAEPPRQIPSRGHRTNGQDLRDPYKWRTRASQKRPAGRAEPCGAVADLALRPGTGARQGERTPEPPMGCLPGWLLGRDPATTRGN
jgi:hypothetical protein